jgi:hypothetical protein
MSPDLHCLHFFVQIRHDIHDSLEGVRSTFDLLTDTCSKYYALSERLSAGKVLFKWRKHFKHYSPKGNNQFMGNSFSLPDVSNNLTKRKWAVAMLSDLAEGNATHSCLLHVTCWFLTWRTLWPWRWRQYSPLKNQRTSARICCIATQKTYSS